MSDRRSTFVPLSCDQFTYDLTNLSLDVIELEQEIDDIREKVAA